MTRKYSQIQPGFWGHPDTQRLSDAGKLLAAYLITGPLTNGLGCYRMPMAYVACDMGWDEEKLRAAFEEVTEIGLALHCERTQWVLLPKFLKWNPPQNPKAAAGRLAEMDDVPRTFTYYRELLDSLRQYGKHIDRSKIPSPPCSDTVSEQVSKPSQNGDEYPSGTVIEEQNITEQNREEGAEPASGPRPAARFARSSEAGQGAAREWAANPDDPVVLEFPTCRKDRPTWRLTQSKLDEYRETYEHLDVLAECRKARQYVRDNPAKRKTPDGMSRYLTGWLNRAQNSGGGVRRGDPPGGHAVTDFSEFP